METENLLANLFKQFDEHVKRLVENQVAEIMMRQASLNVMNDALETKMRELIADIASDITSEAVDRHERDNDHADEDRMYDIANNAMDDYDLDDKIERALRDADMPDESRVEEIVKEALDEYNMQDKVEEVFASDDVWGSGSKFESLVKKVMQNTEFTVNVN